LSAGTSTHPSSLLFWLTGALGDTLLAYPALAAIRRWAPSCTITAVGRPSYYSFAARMGLVDRVIDADGPLGNALFAGGVPIGFEPPHVAVVCSSAHEQLGRNLTALGVAHVMAAPSRPADRRHQARYLLDCLRAVGAGMRLQPVSCPVPVPLSPSLCGLLAPLDRPTILLHPGAGASWKRWPLDRFQLLAAALRAAGAAVRWSCGPADDDLRAELGKMGAASVQEIWPHLDLPDFAAVMSRCSVVVTPDTGVAHLAALLIVPQVTLFGPTDPWRWRPLNRKAIVVRAPELCGGRWRPLPGDTSESRPAELSLRRCDPPDAAGCRCMARLEPTRVLAACRSLLAR
jgi:ADP-heptose:LPS heptosyltransferase